MQLRRSHPARVAGFWFLASMLVLTHAGMTGDGRASAHTASDAFCEPSGSGGLPAVPHTARPIAPSPGEPGLRVVTYNIHSGLGATFSLWESRSEVERNLREIAADVVAAAPAAEPVEVVALNEVDFGSRRSDWIDEAGFLADELKTRTGEAYEIVRGQTWERRALGREVRFGNALLVRLPVLASSSCLFSSASCESATTRDGLPSLRASGLRGLLAEERGVVRATVLVGTRPVDFLVTHLDAFSSEVREGQAMHLLHRFVDPERSTVLLGDLNAVATALTGKRRFFQNERTLDILTSATLADVRASHAAGPASMHDDSASDLATYPADAPVWPLDAVLASVDFVPGDVSVIGRTASDHRGLVARLVPVDGAEALAIQRERHDQTRVAQMERIRRCDIASEETKVLRGWLIEKTGFASLPAPVS